MNDILDESPIPASLAEPVCRSDDYARIERSIRRLCDGFRERGDRPSLAEAARAAHLSGFHFQRLFKRWAGVSPKRFVQFLTAGYARELLAESRSVLDAALEAGLSGPGRLHDLTVGVEAATPGEIRTGGAGLTVRWGVHPGPFGRFLLAATQRGVCGLHFLADGDGGDGDAEPDADGPFAGTTAAEALADVRRLWPAATLRHDPAATRRLAEAAFFGAAGDRPTLHLRGTNFQLQVWAALLRIPEGCATTYGELAARLGRPNSARAVGGAVGANRIGHLIPCHRVLRETGVVGPYRWGTLRKTAMLAREAARRRGDG